MTPNQKKRERDACKGIRAGDYARVRYGRPNDEEFIRLIAEIPPDTRSLTARICGDPVPGRRAIDRRATP